MLHHSTQWTHIMAFPATPVTNWRQKLAVWLERPWLQRFIIALILINAVTLGLETSSTIMAKAGTWLLVIDRCILAVFVVEIVLKLLAYGRRFFHSGWNLFDFTIVAIAVMPVTEAAAVLRALRVLRVLRLFSMVPQLRRVLEGLFASLPGMGAIIAVMGVVFYVSAVLATKLFGAEFPELFGDLGQSLYILFQLMTLENWSDGIVRPISDQHPLALLFFIPFIVVMTFAVLNLFIALIVNSMQQAHESEEQTAKDAERRALREELAALRTEVEKLGDLLRRKD
jgi:voltage-gated sodium channel